MTDMTDRMPSLFVGHGSPMNAVAENDWTRRWRALGETMPKPDGILAISAHWFVPETAVTAMPRPRTIHDFGGFPPELHDVRYPAPGDPDLARRVSTLLAPTTARQDHDWGLDHGTWSVLCHLYPRADVPVVQLSIDETRPASFHYDLARRLAPLRDERILILGSGNIVHNLHAYGWGRHVPEPYDWATRFETRARELLRSKDHPALVGYERLGRDAMLSIPTPDHYLPLLYVIAQQGEEESVTFPVEGVDGGSVSMLAVRVG